MVVREGEEAAVVLNNNATENLEETVRLQLTSDEEINLALAPAKVVPGYFARRASDVIAQCVLARSCGTILSADLVAVVKMSLDAGVHRCTKKNLRKWCTVFTQLMALVPQDPRVYEEMRESRGLERRHPPRGSRGAHMTTHIFNSDMNSPKMLFRDGFWNEGDNNENVRAARLPCSLPCRAILGLTTCRPPISPAPICRSLRTSTTGSPSCCCFRAPRSSSTSL